MISRGFLAGLAVVLVLASFAGSTYAPASVSADARTLTLPAAFKPSMLNNVAVSSTAPVAFVASRDSDTVFAFDPRSAEGIGQVSVGDGPLAVTVFEAGGRRVVGVTCEGFFGLPVNVVELIDASNPAAMTVMRTIPLPEGYEFFLGTRTLRFIRSGSVVLVVATNSKTARGLLLSYDTATGAEIGRVDVGLAPGTLDAVETGDRLVVAVHQSVAPTGRVTLVDASNLAAPVVTHVVRLPKRSGLYNVNNVVLNSDATVGYVATGDGNRFYTFDVESGRVLATVQTGDFPTFSRTFSVGGVPYVVVTAENASNLYAYDVSDPSHPALAWVFDSPSFFLDVEPAISADQSTIFTASTDAGRAYAVDLATGDLRYQASIGDRAVASAVWEGDGKRYPCFVCIGTSAVSTFRDDSSGYIGREFKGPADGVLFTLYQNVAISRDGTIGCVASRRTNEVILFDVATATVIARVPVSSKPSKVAFAEDETGVRRVLALGSGDSVMSIVDATAPASAHVAQQVPLDSPYPFFLEFANIAVAADGRTAYVADGSQFLVAIDVVEGTIVGSVGTGFNPVAIALFEDRGRRKIAVLNTMNGASSVAIVDATNPTAMSVTATAELPAKQLVALNNVPRFTPDGRFVIAGASITESLFSIDADSGAIVGTLADTSAVVPATFSSGDRQRLAVVNLGDVDGRVYRLARSGAPKKGTALASPGGFFLVGNDPLVAPDGLTAYVPNYGRASLLAFDPSTGVATAEMPLGAGPGSVSIDWITGDAISLDVNGSASRVVIRSLADLGPVSAKAPRDVATRPGRRGIADAALVDSDALPRSAATYRLDEGKIVWRTNPSKRK